METTLVLHLLLSISLPGVLAAGQLLNDTGCDCYLTNGSNAAYYAEHRFYDFRELSQYQGTPDTLSTRKAAATAGTTSEYFASSDWTGAWNISIDPRQTSAASPVFMQYSPSNVYIEQNNDTGSTSATFLTLRTARMESFQTAAEIFTASTTYQYVSIRMLARTYGSPGAVTAMYTYLQTGSGDYDVEEADLEIRTMDARNTIQYTNQPTELSGKVVKGATQNVTMPDGLRWTDWAVHRMDWTPTSTTWFVNGAQVSNNDIQVPQDPTKIVFNSWSNGGTWTGNMSVYEQAYLNIQWIEMVFNNTDTVSAWTNSPAAPPSKRALSRRDDDTCKTVCSIDNTNDLGVPVELWSAAPGQSGLLGRVLPMLVLALTVALMFLSGLY